MAWLTGWNYRKSITVSRASGAVSNYQMKLLVGESAGAIGEDVDCGGHCLSNFYDLRFTTTDGETLLNYHRDAVWGETPNQIAKITIKCDSIGTDATTFYMYYGKSDAVDVSDDNATFAPGADFNDGTTTGLTINTTGSGSATVPAITQLFSKIKVDDWIKAYTQNPVLPKRTGKWDSTSTRDLAPFINEDGYPIIDSGKMVFLYRGYGGSSNQGGRATSIDNGLTFEDRLDDPVLPLGPEDSWYEVICCPSSVIKEESTGTFYAFVQGRTSGNVTRIGYFTSTDLGLNWSNDGYVIECGDYTHPDGLTNIGVPWVIKGESGYIMLFEGVGSVTGKFRIYGATASSLSGPWTPMNSGNPIIPGGSSGAWDDFGQANPKLVRIAPNQYIMAYNGQKSGENLWRVGFATATTDLTSWTKHVNNPVLQGEGTGWEQTHCETSAFVKDDSTYLRLWYQGYAAGYVNEQIGFAKCHQGRLLYGLSGATADGYLIGSMQPNTFWSSVLVRDTLDASDDSAITCMLYDSATVPSPALNTTINPLRRFMVLRRSPTNATNPNKFFIAYVDAADGVHYWDGDSWEATATYFGGQGLYEVRIWDDGTNFKADIVEFFSGASILTAVASIAKASVKAFSNGRALVYGDPYTSHYYLGQKFDNMIACKYASPEPAWGSWGAEEPLAITLVVDGLSHADSLGAVALTQVHSLLVNGLNHADSIESLALTQAHLLAIDALSHGHAIEAPALTQVHQLVVQALNHSHTLGAVLLSQVHNLAVQNLAHAHSIENVTLAINFLLVVENLIHAHLLGSANLLQNSLLIVQNLQHSHSIEGSLRLTRIQAIVNEFYYEKLKTAPPSDVAGGDFAYDHVSATIPEAGQAGDFKYKKLS